MPAGVDEIYRSLRFDRDEVNFSKWPKLSCSAANELTLTTPPTQDDPNPGVARLAISGELKLQIGVAVNELSSDEKLSNNSDLAIPTQKAVKTYVDNQITVVNQTLSTKAALNGASSQNFQSNNLSVSGNLTANGNVSIGTTTSSYKLAIAAGDINIDDGRALRQAGRWVIGGDSNVLGIGSSNAPDGRDIRFDPGFAGALTIKKDTGNVGIGTANPGTKLEVKGNLTLDAGDSPFLYTGTGNSELNRYLELLNSPARRSASGLKAGGILISDSYAYANPSKNDLIVKGNVGIGTSNPSQKLDVIGNINYTGVLTKLDTAEQFSVTVRAADFLLGHSGRRGNPGRALVDSGSVLGINWDADWSSTEIRSNLIVRGQLYVDNIPFGDRRNMQWDSSSKLFYHDNSSRKSKENITSLVDDFSKVLTVDPKTYTRPNNPDHWEIGYIAEEFHELGLERLVYYDEDGSPGAINYPKICMYLTEIIKKHEQTLKEYEDRINQLEQ
jgi:hypothetical protein